MSQVSDTPEMRNPRVLRHARKTKSSTRPKNITRTSVRQNTDYNEMITKPENTPPNLINPPINALIALSGNTARHN
jgi:hypothetical protein